MQKILLSLTSVLAVFASLSPLSYGERTPGFTNSGDRSIVTNVNEKILRLIVNGAGIAKQLEPWETNVYRMTTKTGRSILITLDKGAADGAWVKLFAGFTGAADYEMVNSWNKNHDFSRAMVDPKGQWVIDANLFCEAGVTPETIGGYITGFASIVDAFANYIGAP